LKTIFSEVELVKMQFYRNFSQNQERTNGLSPNREEGLSLKVSEEFGDFQVLLEKRYLLLLVELIDVAHPNPPLYKI